VAGIGADWEVDSVVVALEVSVVDLEALEEA